MCMEDMESEVRSRNQCCIAGAENAEANAPLVPRPPSTWLERAIFNILHRWRWIAAALLLCAVAAVFPLVIEAASYRRDGLVIPVLVRWALLSLPIIATAAFPFVRQAFRPASAGIIRVALSAATDDARIFLHTLLRDALKSGGAGNPIQRDELFRLFNQARGERGNTALRKRQHMEELRKQQMAVVESAGA